MVRLHYANRLENLIAPLAAAIRARQQSHPLQRIPVIVPNRAIEEFVKLRVAEQTGVAANLDFPFLRRFLADKLRAADPTLRIVEFEQLQVMLFECIRRGAVRDDRELAAVRDYIAGGSGDEADQERRTMELAGHIARLFREYSISRRAMIGGGTPASCSTPRRSKKRSDGSGGSGTRSSTPKAGCGRIGQPIRR